MRGLKIRSYGISDKGLLRLSNEDNFIIQDNIFMVADGMGGHNAGEIASELTIQSILRDIKNYFSSNNIKQNSIIDYQDLIIKLIRKANRNVIQKALKDPILNGMGTTLVLAFFQKPDVMHFANVGDSRAYLFRKKDLTMISEDHSLAQVMKDKFNSKNEKSIRYKNYLTRAVGINLNIEPYYKKINLISGDIILLCSDGLWNMISDIKICKILQKNISNKMKCKEFIDMANNKGGFDNITVVILSISNV